MVGIILESIIIIYQPDKEQPKTRPGGGKVHHFGGHQKAFEGDHRIAILTVPASARHLENSKAYGAANGYEVISVRGSVLAAASALRRDGGDASFIRPFALLRFISQNEYDWVFWQATGSVFLNFSRRLDTFLDPQFDMILSTQPCNSQSATPVTHIEGVNTDNMLLKNSKATISTLKAVWSLWNHSHCKYEDSECRVLNGRAQYAQGDASALKVVLKNSEIQKV